MFTHCHGQVVMELIDTPWNEDPTLTQWYIRHWICRKLSWNIETFTVCTVPRNPQCTAGHPGNPLCDWPAALQGSAQCCPGPTSPIYVEHRAVLYQTVLASHI